MHSEDRQGRRAVPDHVRDAEPQATPEVLLVEDDASDAELIERALSQGGLRVHLRHVDRESTLRDALRAGHWDLVLTDFRLPSIDGLGVLRMLRDAGADVPAIVVSGTVGEEVAAQLMREGARDFVLKSNLARLPEAARRELTQAQHRARARRLEDILAALRDVALETARLLDPFGHANFAIAKARELLDVDIAAVYWWSERRQLLELLAESGSGGVSVQTIAAGHGASGVAYEQQAPVFIDDYSVWPQRLGDLTGSALAVPAIVGDRILGTLYVRSLARRKFTDADAAALQLFASQVAPAIQVSRLLTDLRASEQRFSTIFRQNPVGIIATSAKDSTIIDVNDSFLELIGNERADFIGRSAKDLGLLTPTHEQALRSAFRQAGALQGIEVRVVGRKGEAHDTLVYSQPIELGHEPAVLSTIVDITARRSAERMLQHNSLHDELTGLPNRFSLYEHLRSLVSTNSHVARDGHIAVLLLNLDGFAALNEELGHHGADLALTQVARLLRARLAPEHFFARAGGDEFAVVLRDAAHGDPETVARELLSSLQAPSAIGSQQVLIGASVGIAVHPEDAATAEDLLKCASLALQTVKPVGWTYARYEGPRRHGARTGATLLSEFRDAIRRDGELFLVYQPQFELPSRRLVGAEALLRWQHPRLGLLTPPSFLPTAERTVLMGPLLEWVLATALEETAAGGLPVSVNLAMRNLLEAGLYEAVVRALEKSRRPPADLTLEVTEGGLMTRPETAASVLDRLRTLGCRLSIDDFGTGYSSMAYLQRLPTHELKIDRSFVSGIPADSRNTSIVQASVALAHGLGLVAVAEGVETEANISALMALGCDRAQGYLLGRPGPAARLFEPVNAQSSG